MSIDSLPIAREIMIEDAQRAARQGIECWLSWQNRTDELRLPVTPFFDLSKSKNNQTLNLYEFGDVNIPGNLGLKSFDIESFFPHRGHNYNFCPRDTDDPYSYCRLIDKWFSDVYPIRVIFTNTNINISMLIESFNYGETDRTRDVYFKLSLREYRFIDEPSAASSGGTTFENAVANSYNPEYATSGGRSGTPIAGMPWTQDAGDWDYSEWTAKYGDTITGISIAKFGDETHVDKIIELNKDLIKKPDSLKNLAGQVLRLE